MPRAYSMERRSEQVAATRDRIVAAAAEVFSQRGARATTMTEVARQADVSTATVTNHFPTPEALLEAVIDHLKAGLGIPDAGIFSETDSLPARLQVLAEVMFEFFDRTSMWFDLLGAELTDVPAVKRARDDFWRSLQQLYARALAGSEDSLLAQATAGLIHPSTLGALRWAGLSSKQAAEVVVASLAQLARRTP